MTNNSMKEDRELNLWREEWSAVAPPSPEFQRQIHERIKLHDRRFLIGNLLTVAVFVGMLAYAVYLSHQGSWLGECFPAFAPPEKRPAGGSLERAIFSRQ